jgi:hypothetical protein
MMRLVAYLMILWISSLLALPVLALPPPADQPEEVLRTEIILEARSPIDGQLMTAAEYAELQAQIEARNQEIGYVPPQIRRLVGLLRLRKALRTIFPFIR